jgi:hypothetical protein
MTTQTQFNFVEYNKAMTGAGAGLKLFLVEQLLEDISKTCRRFDNPLKREVNDLLDEVTQLRKQWKAIAEKRERTSDVAAKVDAAMTA